MTPEQRASARVDELLAYAKAMNIAMAAPHLATGIIALADADGFVLPTCVECGEIWNDNEERWRSYLTVDGETALYCLDCAREEFGNS